MYSVPYGRTSLQFDVPAGMTGAVVKSNEKPSLENPGEGIKQALRCPLESQPLREVAKPTDRVAVVVTDITRSCPDHLLVPPLLDELEAAGVPATNITIVVGVGLHRASTEAERREMLGDAVVDRVRIIDHNALDTAGLKDLGRSQEGVPCVVNKFVAESDLVVATGIVEPHHYAGFSGGRKTIAVGCGGEAFIGHTHGLAMLEHPKVRLGVIEDNPFHLAACESARRAGLRFVINVVANDAGQIVAVRAGEPTSVLESLVAFAREMYTVPIPHQYDIVVGGVGFPKDQNLYQASRAATYLFFAPTPVARPGGVYIIPAECTEGAGDGTGEKRFIEGLCTARDIPSLLAKLRAEGYRPGEQRAYMVARAMEHNDIIVVGATCQDLIRSAHMIPAADMASALAIAAEKVGSKADVLVVPHALLTLPIVQQ